MKKFLLAVSLVLGLSFVANAVPSGPNVGFVLSQELSLFSEQFGKLTWVETLTIGDKVTLLGKAQKFTRDGKEREYTYVRTPSGKEGWLRTQYIAVNATLGVIKTDSALIYSEPRDLKITDKAMTMLTIVAILDNGSTPDFAKVNAVNPADDVYYDTNATYLTYPDLTIDENDVAAAILYYVGKNTKNAGVKKNLLTLANKKYASSVFLPKIQEVLGGAPAASAAAAVPFAGTYPLNDTNVNVRTAPSTEASVISQLSQPATVTVKERTAQPSAAGGKTDYWYHITAPVDGWVFGSFLTIKP